MSQYDDKLELEVERYLITEDFYPLSRMLKTYIKGKSRKYARICKAKKLRIYQDDFESVLWEAAVDLIHDEGYHSHRFRIVLNYRLEDRARNCLRDYMRDKRKGLTTAVSRHGFPSNEYTEETAINQVLIEQMANEPTLTTDEQRLFSLLREEPSASNQELADKMNYNHREKIRRLRHRLSRRLYQYEND